MRLAFAPYRLIFKVPARTSREVMTEKPTFLIKVYDENNPEKYGLGEAAVFPGLSPEADGNYVNKLIELMANVALGRETDLSSYSSIQFGFEQALLDYSNNCNGIYYPGIFTKGESIIKINGLIWMDSFTRMMESIEEKINEGFRCIKLKIGGISFEEELKILKKIRQHYRGDELSIRLDANGSFDYSTALKKLELLAVYEIHSIEQPLKPGNFEQMRKICRESPIPVALDEELIGKGSTEEKIETLDEIEPSFIVLKPALCGGFSGADEWIRMAEERGIGWWITSALESNVGLNAISQYAGTKILNIPQGLGTGQLFVNNFNVPLKKEGENLFFNPCEKFDHKQFSNLMWHS